MEEVLEQAGNSTCFFPFFFFFFEIGARFWMLRGSPICRGYCILKHVASGIRVPSAALSCEHIRRLVLFSVSTRPTAQAVAAIRYPLTPEQHVMPSPAGSGCIQSLRLAQLLGMGRTI